MIESLFIAAGKHRGACARFGRWLGFGPSGWWIAALVVVLVGGRLLWEEASRPAYRDEIAEAFGSVGYLYGAPQTSRSGERFTFIQTTTNGIGLFVGDTATGQRQLVAEESGKEKGGVQDLALWPWSPDDKRFIYTRKNIVICQGETGGELAKISIGSAPVKSLVWLTPDTFTYAGADGKLKLVRRQSDGKWQRTDVAGVTVGSAPLAALSSNSIAWKQTNGLWTMNLDAPSATRLYQAPAGQTLDDFACSRDTGKVLLKLRQANQASLWQLTPGNDPIKIAACPPTASAISWLNATNSGCAYLCPKSGNASESVLVLQSCSPAESSRLFTRGTAEKLTVCPDGRHLFIVGVVSNEPAEGIWEYDVPSEKLQCVVPCSARPSPYARHVDALHCTFKLASGRKVDYYLYPPVNFDRQRHKKYPLVIGDTVYQMADAEHQGRVHGPLWAEAVACCDAYVVIVNRASWFGGLDQWGQNVTEVYQHLAQNPTIDTRRVFLFGASAETSPLSALVKARPDLWKGLLLLNPSGLPQIGDFPPGQSAPKILLSAGEAEGSEKYLKKYQAEAGQNGVAVAVVIHPNSTHWVVSIAAMQERTRAMLDFIFEN